MKSIIIFIYRVLNKLFSSRKGSFFYPVKLFFYSKQFKSFGKNVVLYFPLTIEVKDKISIGNDTSIGTYSHMWGNGGIIIGQNVMIATHVCISSATHDYTRRSMNKHNQVLKKVIINDSCWIGTGAIILPGVEIGEGAVVGAGSVVTKDVPPYAIVTGNPAQVKKYREIKEA